MESLKSLIAGAVAGVVVLIGGLFLLPHAATPPLGAVATLDGVDLPFTSIAGYKEYRITVPITATSTTFCSILNPYSATTTLKYASANIRTSNMAAAVTIDISTSTTLYASSTPAFVFGYSVPNRANGDYVAWDAPMATTSQTIIGKNPTVGNSYAFLRQGERLNFRVATGTPGTGNTFTGTCSAVFAI